MTNKELTELNNKGIWFVEQFPTVSLEVDFERPDLAQNEMIKLTEEVEKNSGIAKFFDKPDNSGEGWVWTFIDDRGNRQVWKTKGEDHVSGKGTYKVIIAEGKVTINGKIPSNELQKELEKQLGEGIYNFSL